MPNPNYSRPPYMPAKFFAGVRRNPGTKFELNPPELTTYLYQLGGDDSDDISAILASSPEDAMEKAKAERTDWELEEAIRVYTCTKHWPQVDVKWMMDFYGEGNPDVSPIAEAWSVYIGKEAVEAIQAAVDAAIKRYCSPLLMLDECLLTCTHEWPEDDATEAPAPEVPN